MHVIHRRNVHNALPAGLNYLHTYGFAAESRNGPVLVSPTPVTTVYNRPLERVIFHPERDANPFFHLYEMLWMVAGRRDVEGPRRYAQNMANFTDDGITYHGAYGYRWRKFLGVDQLPVIVEALKKDPTDRRCVLQMWNAADDLGKSGKDFPCNTIATLQLHTGSLDLAVFCRSNDILWGAYGANAVHFSFLQEYLANWIGCPIGTYTQVSVNYHAYTETDVFKKSIPLIVDGDHEFSSPYSLGLVKATTLGEMNHNQVDSAIDELLFAADNEFVNYSNRPHNLFWTETMYRMLFAHQVYRTTKGPDRYQKAMDILRIDTTGSDWELAGWQWLERRQRNFANKVN